jgi:ATP-binding cassette subfamily B protein
MALFCVVKSMAALLRHFHGHEKWVMAGMGCLLLTNFFGVVPPQIIRRLMDAVGGNQPNGLGILLLGLLGATLARGITMYWMRQTLIVMSRRCEQALKDRIFAQILAMSPSKAKGYASGDLISRITEDVGKIRMFLGPGLMYSLNLLVLFVLVIGVMMRVSPQLTLWVLTPLPFLVLGIYLLNLRILVRSAAIQAHLGRMTAFVQESLMGMKLIQAFGAEPGFRRVFEGELEGYKTKNLAFARADALFFPLALALVGLSTLLTVWVGGHLLAQGQISLGNIAEFIIYINMLTWPVTSLGWVASIYQQSKAAQARIEPLLSASPRPHREQGWSEPLPWAWSLNRVQFQYSDSGFTLEIPEFKASPGDFIGITGTIGSGKSTLWQLLAGQIIPTGGAIVLGTHSLQQWNEAVLYQHTAWVPQDNYFFNDTLLANLRLGAPDADAGRCMEVLELVELGTWVGYLPQGLDTVIGERGVQLSGGQKQRLALARAWIRNPAWVILDDALSALDSATEEVLMSKLLGNQGNRGIILISLKIKPLIHADQIYVLHQGTIIASGQHQDLLMNCELYAQMHRMQVAGSGSNAPSMPIFEAQN